MSYVPRSWNLSPQILRVLQGYADGGTRKTIAAELGIGERTVAEYLQRGRKAIGAKTPMHAIAEVVRKERIE